MIKSDEWIHVRARGGMIHPYVADNIRRARYELIQGSPTESELIPDNKNGEFPVISFGSSSYGYDIRLSPKDFRIFCRKPGQIVDPKNFDPGTLVKAPLRTCVSGDYFVLPAHTYGLGVALEKLEIPENVTVICLGKSTYARCGIICNTTPGEAGWSGHLTLEISNSSDADCRIYANEGIAQLLFFEGKPCAVSYATREGKYQDQGQEVTLAKM